MMYNREKSLAKFFYLLADTPRIWLHRVEHASVEVYGLDTRQTTSHHLRAYKMQYRGDC